jgi:O-antigen/teichoic acid export membrane protein
MMKGARKTSPQPSSLGHDSVPSGVESIQVVGGAAGTALVGRITGRGVSLITQVAVARLLGPASYGLYALGLTAFKLVGLTAILGMDRGVIRIGSKYLGGDPRKLRDVILQGVGIAVLAGSAMGLVTYFVAPWLATFFLQSGFDTGVFRWFAPGFGLFAGLRVAASATTLSQDTRYMVRAQELVQPGLELALVGLVYLGGWKLYGAITAALISTLVALVVALTDLRRLFLVAGGGIRRLGPIQSDMIKYSLSLTAYSVLLVMLQWVDRFLVAIFLPSSSVGIYQAAAQASLLFVVILTALNSAFSPRIADLSEKRDYKDLEVHFRVVTKWGLYVSLPLYLVVIFLPSDLMSFVYGPQFVPGAIPLAILSSGQVINLATGAVGLLLVMNDQVRRWTLIASLMLATNVVMGLVLIPRYGLVGAAVSTSLAVSGQFLLGLGSVKAALGISPYDRRYFKGLVSGTLTALLVFLVSRVVQGSDVVRLMVAGLVAVGGFSGLLLLFGLDQEDKLMLNLVRRRFGFRSA